MEDGLKFVGQQQAEFGELDLMIKLTFTFFNFNQFHWIVERLPSHRIRLNDTVVYNKSG